MSISTLQLDKATQREMQSFENRWKLYGRNHRAIYLKSKGLDVKGNETGDKLISIAMAADIEPPTPDQMMQAVRSYRAKINGGEIKNKPVESYGNMSFFELKSLAKEKGMDVKQDTKKPEIMEFLND